MTQKYKDKDKNLNIFLNSTVSILVQMLFINIIYKPRCKCGFRWEDDFFIEMPKYGMKGWM